jgi:AbrB family looped-hinge helix DNA binding protein
VEGEQLNCFMEIVTIKNKYQVVIPQAIRNQLGLSRGDVLEAKVERGRLIYTPKMVIDRIPAGKVSREQFFKQLRAAAPASLKAVWTASKRHGTDKLTMRAIDAEVSAVRRGPARKITKPAR